MIFATIMKDKKSSGGYFEKLLKKYRFVVMTEASFEEKFSFRLSSLNVLFLFSGFLLAVFLLAVFLIAFSPLKDFIPGKSKKEVQKELIELSLIADSLEKTLQNNSLYLKNISNIIQGKELVLTTSDSANLVKENPDLFFESSTEDSLFRLSVEEKEKGSIFIGETRNNNLLMFFPPLNGGLIIDGFDLGKKHFGIDLLAKENSKISAVLDGVVIISHWSAETGFVLGLQHKNNYLSFYKHNSILLKEVGDYVVAGEHIAVIGNSGELSSGPHLHFELWREGVPVNPKDYISF